MSVRSRAVKITAAATLSIAALGVGASAAIAGDPSQWGRARAEVDGDPSQWESRKVNEYEGQHRKVNEYEGQHR
ncbi:MAG TPA: hypothetical protein VHF27_00475 [Acidimicrobiales bacterium]|nr:hypothetical protein [Acidimicrobiales bacterium]